MAGFIGLRVEVGTVDNILGGLEWCGLGVGNKLDIGGVGNAGS